MERKMILSLFVAFVIFIPNIAFANTEPNISDVVSDTIALDDGYYFETVIEDADTSFLDDIQNIMLRGTTTKTKSKTTYYKNSSGSVMWYVRVTGTFTYGNGSSKCTNSECTAESKSKAWKVSNKSASKTGNSASASAKGTHYLNGVPAESITRTVTLKCSPSGNFS